MSMFAVLLVLLSSVGNGAGSVFLKKLSFKKTNNILSLLLNRTFILGITIYATAAVLYVIALKYGDISVLYPIAATQYIWVCIFAVRFFREKINILKWSGIIMIIAGAVFIGLGL
ncbi:EamA family transporter [Candidatus Woesearchaeota archaeon]|nr:EamA family transporter [Candidatus Woesearchaeota archaeon]